MLLSMIKQKDKRRGESGPVLLPPELCYMTGEIDIIAFIFRSVDLFMIFF
jgi:hypothetical protein